MPDRKNPWGIEIVSGDLSMLFTLHQHGPFDISLVKSRLIYSIARCLTNEYCVYRYENTLTLKS